MDGSSVVSVVIPWRDREELETTLFCNAPLFLKHSAEIIVVNMGGDCNQLSGLIAGSGLPDVRQVEVQHDTFNKSLALNIGITLSGGPLVLILDTDIVLTADIFEYVDHIYNNRSYMTIEWVHESEVNPLAFPTIAGAPVFGNFISKLVHNNGLEFSFEDGRTLDYQSSRVNKYDGTRAAPGLLLTRKDYLVEVGGYNSNLCEWGWEDDDLQIRLRHVLGLSHIEACTALHLTHGDDRRALSNISRTESDRRNFLKCCSNYNRNDFQGTYIRDINEVSHRLSERACDPQRLNHIEIICPSGYPSALPARIEHCGAEAGTLEDDCKNANRSEKVPSLGQAILEALLWRMDLRGKNMLHVGCGNSRLALRFASLLSHIDGVTSTECDLDFGRRLCLRNYKIELLNKYSNELRTYLPRTIYDVIVDNDLINFACCRAHLHVLLDSYACLLAPAGQIVFEMHRAMRASIDEPVKLTGSEMAYFAGQCGMSLKCFRNNVYIMTHCK